MPLFNGDEFRAMIEKATYVIVNDYESQLLQQRTGWSAAEIASRVKAYIVTQGPRGSLIHVGGKTHRDSAGARAPDRRSDRLRRRLSRRPDLRHHEGPGLADHRPHGVADGR
jgi:hypothetical protein